MSIKDDLRKKLDVNSDGRVNFRDVVWEVESRLGAIQTRWAFGGFCAGVVACFVVLKVIL